MMASLKKKLEDVMVAFLRYVISVVLMIVFLVAAMLLAATLTDGEAVLMDNIHYAAVAVLIGGIVLGTVFVCHLDNILMADGDRDEIPDEVYCRLPGEEIPLAYRDGSEIVIAGELRVPSCIVGQLPPRRKGGAR